jgi:hypothetical protein
MIRKISVRSDKDHLGALTGSNAASYDRERGAHLDERLRTVSG